MRAARAVLPAAVLLAFGLAMAVLFSLVSTLVSPLEDEVPQDGVVLVRVAPVEGQ